MEGFGGGEAIPIYLLTVCKKGISSESGKGLLIAALDLADWGLKSLLI